MNGRNKAPGYEIWKAMSAGSRDKPKQCSEFRELEGGGWKGGGPTHSPRVG
jgi:hypothetical protein